MARVRNLICPFFILEHYCKIMLKEGILDKIQEQDQAASSSFNFSEKVMELAKIVKETVVSYE